jgi:hypothetical protein
MIFPDAELQYQNNNVEGWKGLSGISADDGFRDVKDSTVSI